MSRSSATRSSLCRVLVASVAVALLIGCGEGKPDYSFSYSGPTGPEYWGEMNSEWVLAKTGHEQSPINITDAQPGAGGALVLDYRPTPLDIVNNGHTIQVNVAPGSSLSVDDESYALQQFHFHVPSEHTIDKELRAMEAHLVHANAAGELLVVGVLFEDGGLNEFLDGFWARMPESPGQTFENASVKLDINTLLPTDLASWRYAGSLTTPPCSEGVRWVVLQSVVQASASQMADFTARIGRNNRPVQPTGGREITTVD